MNEYLSASRGLSTTDKNGIEHFRPVTENNPVGKYVTFVGDAGEGVVAGIMESLSDVGVATINSNNKIYKRLTWTQVPTDFIPLKSFNDLPKDRPVLALLAGPQIDIVVWDDGKKAFIDYYYKQTVSIMFGYWELPAVLKGMTKTFVSQPI